MQKTILLIDDEGSLRRTLALGLGQRGWDTEPCETGMGGLKKLELFMKNDLPPAAVVIDVQLPDIQGTRLAKIIRFKYPGIPIILITGYADKLNPEEIQNLQVSAFLEKPFSADELSDRFEEILHEKPKKKASEMSETARTQSAYLLIKADAKSDIFELYRELYYMEGVLYCDATKGEHDVVLLIQGESGQELENVVQRVKSVTGVAEVDDLRVAQPLLDENTRGLIDMAEDALSKDGVSVRDRDLGNRVSSYVLVEVEKEKVETLYPWLRLSENVVYCDYTEGSFNMVLLVYGSYFDEIDRLIQEKIAPLEGVLRVKEFPIINMFEM